MVWEQSPRWLNQRKILLVSLANALTHNSTVQRLYLRCCRISDDDIKLLAAALPEMKGLKFLDLVGHHFGEGGAKAFLAGLKENVRCNGVRLPFKYDSADDIEFYLALNRGGRRLLKETNISAILWPLILKRSNRFVEQHYRADVHFHLLQGPLLLDR